MKILKFKSYEEISKKFPLDNVHNKYYSVTRCKANCVTDADYKILKTQHPFGYMDEDNKYIYFSIYTGTIYDHYCYNGEYWFLGLDGWDGIGNVHFPHFGKNLDYNGGIFKTYKEAEKYAKYLAFEFLYEF